MIVLLVLLVSCNSTKEQNVIAFSCIYCKGCVASAFKFIAEEDLFNDYRIVVDTTCHSPRDLKFPYQHMDLDAMFGSFGRFGNFILIDSTGHTTVFNSNMPLRDHFK